MFNKLTIPRKLMLAFSLMLLVILAAYAVIWMRSSDIKDTVRWSMRPLFSVPKAPAYLAGLIDVRGCGDDFLIALDPIRIFAGLPRRHARHAIEASSLTA